MACASALLALQFVLQYTLGLRAMGVTQAVLLNLVVFVPCSCLFTFALLYLQRHERLSRKDWLPWVAALGGCLSPHPRDADGGLVPTD